MSDTTISTRRFFNPWVLHLQKLSLELKCPLCLTLFDGPMLLPCDHIFCKLCVRKSEQVQSECPICKVQYSDRELRKAPYMENMVSVYRNMDVTLCSALYPPVSSGMVSAQSPSSIKKQEPVKTIQEGNMSSGMSSFNKCSTPRIEVADSENHKSPQPSSQLGVNGYLQCGNQVAQSSPGSPPSFGDPKTLDDDCSDQGSEQSSEKYSVKRSLEKNCNNKSDQDRTRIPASGHEECHLQDNKRQKKSNYGHPEIGIKSNTREQVLSRSLVSMVSKSAIESKLPSSGEVPSLISDHVHGSKTVCAFCQSSDVTEETGPMLHYANGNLVEGNDSSQSHVIHVHGKCIEWAPQVYYKGDTVKNLKAEVARGSKLKCSSCGLKGAALGCYAKSCRRTYHVPCAVRIPECRWDCENYLVLCPSHSSLRFPNEKSNPWKQAVEKPNQMTPEQSQFWADSSNGPKEWVLCGSALSAEDKFLMVEFARMCGATVSKLWKPDVTHVIAASDENGACCRTLKVLMAILHGKWIIKIDWIKACMELMCPLNEEPFEISVDNHGCLDGPKTGRLRAFNNVPKLFIGLNFHFTGGFLPAYMRDLQGLITAADGTIITNVDKLLTQDHDSSESLLTTLVIYNLDPPQGCKSGEDTIVVMQRQEEAKRIASKINSRAIPHTWLLESIAACKLQPFTMS